MKNAITAPPADDIALPFQIEASSLRGRLVRLSEVVDDILTRHAYAEPVARLVGETVTLAAMMASALKYDGVFTLQAKGDGPVKLLVADVTSGGDIRGYAKVGEDAEIGPELAGGPVPALLGQGYLAFTVDQGEHTERYQGIVELTGATLSECLQHYFRQSEQIDVGLKLAIERTAGSWRAGGILLQRLPDEERQALPSDRTDDWRRAMILMDSASDGELLDPGLAAETLLYRLFHEDGVRVWEPQPLSRKCRCSTEKVERVLQALPVEEVASLKAEDGQVHVVCEFCNTDYVYTERDIRQLKGEPTVH